MFQEYPRGEPSEFTEDTVLQKWMFTCHVNNVCCCVVQRDCARNVETIERLVYM
jgi:hypothetical protein